MLSVVWEIERVNKLPSSSPLWRGFSQLKSLS